MGNPVIADLFHRMKYMERRGSGIRKILDETAKLPGYTNDNRPTLRSTPTSFCVILRSVKKNNPPVNTDNTPVNTDNTPVNTNNTPVNTNNTPVNTSNLPTNLQEIIDLIKADKNISYTDIAQKLGRHRDTVRRQINKLRNNYNILKRIGADKNGHWEIVTPPTPPVQ